MRQEIWIKEASVLGSGNQCQPELGRKQDLLPIGTLSLRVFGTPKLFRLFDETYFAVSAVGPVKKASQLNLCLLAKFQAWDGSASNSNLLNGWCCRSLILYGRRI